MRRTAQDPCFLQEDTTVSNPYTPDFYERNRIAVRKTAEAVVPIVIELMCPKSVIDIGCGEGDWLACFRAHGVQEIIGMDGDHIFLNDLAIPVGSFQACDLKEKLTAQDLPRRRFDLAVCLEVGEHLPKDLAGKLVQYLTSLAPVVLFSAAVPGQLGPSHINCQWPPFWFDLFESRGFVTLDPIREHIWKNPSIPWWYAQNIFLFCSKEHRHNYVKLSEEQPFDTENHLTILRAALAWKEPTMRDIAGMLGGTLKRSATHWIGVITGRPRAQMRFGKSNVKGSR